MKKKKLNNDHAIDGLEQVKQWKWLYNLKIELTQDKNYIIKSLNKRTNEKKKNNNLKIES